MRYTIEMLFNVEKCQVARTEAEAYSGHNVPGLQIHNNFGQLDNCGKIWLTILFPRSEKTLLAKKCCWHSR